MTTDPRVARVERFFTTLTRDTVKEVRTLYAADARFKDPFNEIQGVERIEHLFRHMFDQVDEPRFEIEAALADGDQAFLTWLFRFRRKGTPGDMTIRGGTHLRFDPAGKVALHRDYWDAAEELYEKLPVIGALMRWLKRRAAA